MSKRNIAILIFSIIVVVGFFSSRSVAYDWFTVPSVSMKPTINPGATILVHKAAYGIRLPFSNIWLSGPDMPRRGEMVIFRYPRDPSQVYIKRVLAVGGDQLQLTPQGDIYINGEKLKETPLPPEKKPDENGNYYLETNGKESYLTTSQGARAHPTMTITIDPNKFFVIGDNRDMSSDSRHWGQVPLNNIQGRVQFIDNRISPLLVELNR